MNKKRKPRILLNACMYTEKPNGNGIYIREIFNRLSLQLDAKGIDYVCFAYTKKGLINHSKIQLIRVPFGNSSFNKLISIHRLLWNLFILPIIARRFNLVYSFSNHGSAFIKNQVITIHDLICFEFPRQNKFQYLYNKFFLPAIIRSCKNVVAISAFTKQMIIRHFANLPSKVITIYNGGDHLKQSSPLFSISSKVKLDSLTGGESFFLCVGATYPHKNAEAVIRAMKTIKNKYRLIITGPSNRYYRQIKKQLAATNTTNVILLDYVDQEFLQYLYFRCIGNVYISLHEGFGFPPMEAAGYNKVSLLSTRGSLPEVYGDAACYVDPHDTAAIVQALENIGSGAFDNDASYEKYKQLFSTYTWAKTVNAIYSLVVEPLLAGEAAQ